MPKGQVVPKLKAAPKARSAVSNRTRLFVDRDARGPWARRYADLVAIIAEDLGGAERLTELKLGMVRRAAALTLECERLEGELASGRPVDVDALGRVAGHVRRISETLGLDKVMRDVTPSLEDIVKRYQTTDAKPSSKKPAATPPVVEAAIAAEESEEPSTGFPSPSVEAAE